MQMYIFVMHIHVHVLHTVYFDNLNNESKDIRYTLRFPYEQNWNTKERVDSFVINQANTDRSA